MAAHGWRSSRALSAQLRDDCAGFDYYQLVRLLLAERGGDGPERHALDACLRFGADLSAAFPGREITRLADPGGAAPVQLGASNYCVAGVLGPLPEPFIEWLRARVRDGDDAMLRFLDLFNHRLHTLRYTLKCRFNPGLNNQHPEHTDNAAYLAAVMGLLQPGLAEQLPVSKRALLAVAGLLSDPRRSAAAIGQALGLFLGTEVHIEQLAGGWAPIAAEQRSALGRGACRLGGEAPLGRRFWDPQGRIVVTLGPMSHDRYCALLPGGSGHAALVALLRHLTDRQVDCEVRLQLDPAGQPAPRLGGGRSGMRLAYSAWPQDHRLVRVAMPFASLHARLDDAEQCWMLVALMLLCLYRQLALAESDGSRPLRAVFLVRAWPAQEAGDD